MKKMLTILVTTFFVFILFACSGAQNNEAKTLVDKAYESLVLTFESGDSENHISKDFRLPLFVAAYPDVSLVWASSNDDMVKPVGLFARVNAPQRDTKITLKGTLNYQKINKDKNFELNIIGYADYEFTGYYESLSGLLLEAFSVELLDMIQTKGSATGSTAQVKSVDIYDGQNYSIYTGNENYGNREHVWPNSHLGNAPSYDLHNLRAANVGVNSTRGNRYFTAFPEGGSWKTVGQGFYPGEEHIGDVARIILYIYLRYDLNIQLVGTLDLFLMWHEMDPVSLFEISRNNKIYAIQNNRNPFIDYPNLVDVLFS